MSEKEHTELLKARHDLWASVTKLLERSYELGYADGKEDAENRHKQHVMNVLKQGLEKH